jgi:hypothetical protein
VEVKEFEQCDEDGVGIEMKVLEGMGTVEVANICCISSSETLRNAFDLQIFL